MINLYESSLSSILPNYLKTDHQVNAFCYAIDNQIKKLLDKCKSLEIWSNLPDADEELLDYLAAELRTQYYTPNLNTEVKRNLVANTLIWYQKAGTVAAVEELVSALFGEGTISEWHDYDGLPHHFKIITTNPEITGDLLEKFNSVISQIKRITAILDAVEIAFSATIKTYYGFALHIHDSITVRQEV